MLVRYLGYSDELFVWYLIPEPGIVCQTGCGKDGLKAKSGNRLPGRLAHKPTQSQSRYGHRGCWVISLVRILRGSREQETTHMSTASQSIPYDIPGWFRSMYVAAAVHDVGHRGDFAKRSHA